MTLAQAALPTSAAPKVAAYVRRFAVANLVAEVGIVVSGGLVRLTGSGLGCPSWPQCVPGSYTPVVHQAQGFHKDIEFGNRLLTFVVSAAAVGVLVAALRGVRGRRRLTWLAAVPFVGVLAQATLGGVTVLTGLSPLAVAAHFLLSMGLVAVSTLLVLALAQPRQPATAYRSELRWLAVAVAAMTGVVLVLGTVVTGAGPHSGDADRPARFALDPRIASWLHADAVLLLVGLVGALILALRLTGAPRRARRRALAVLAVIVAQGGVGYAQYVAGLPTALVALHMLGASLLVVTVTALVAGLMAFDGGRDQKWTNGSIATATKSSVR